MSLITAERVVTMQRLLSQQNAELQTLNATLERYARTDPLTGLANRRHLDDDLQRLQGMASRYHITTSLAVCDLDRFKAYNDRFGHVDGDHALRRVADVLMSVTREADTVYRLGGEELLVLLPNQSAASATVAADRLRAAVQAADIPHPDNTPFGVVTVSIGVAELDADEYAQPARCVERADVALYIAKHAGRNRVIRHAPDMPSPCIAR
jgi:diguanylate cyclase (GGDEF)-like protein